MSRRRRPNRSVSASAPTSARVLREEVDRRVAQAELHGINLLEAELVSSARAAVISHNREVLEGGGPDQLVNISDYLGEPGYSTTYGGSPGGGWLNTLSDRFEGRDQPLFLSEQELALQRGMARVLFQFNDLAQGCVKKLTEYVVHTGMVHQAISRTGDKASMPVKTAQLLIDDFLEINDWQGNKDQEQFRRVHRDGECFDTLWHVGGGRVEHRFAEPAGIIEPANGKGLERDFLFADDDPGEPLNWRFGVCTTEGDVEETRGYYVQWEPRPDKWDFLPGGKRPIMPQSSAARNSWCEHSKNLSDATVKRGVSDFFTIGASLELARKIRRNTSFGAALQAAIAWFVKTPTGTTSAAAQAIVSARATAQYQTTTQAGTQVHQIRDFQPGSIPRLSPGQEPVPGPMGSERASHFLDTFTTMLRSIGNLWSMPDYMLTSSSDSNYASSLVAESPFVRAMECEQQRRAAAHKRLLWRVLWFGWVAGRFAGLTWEDVQREVAIKISPPRVATRDADKNTVRLRVLWEDGIISDAQRASEEGYDFAQQTQDGAHVRQVQPMQGGSGGTGGGSPGGGGSGLGGPSNTLAQPKSPDAQNPGKRGMSGLESVDITEAWTDEAREKSIEARQATAKANSASEKADKTNLSKDHAAAQRAHEAAAAAHETYADILRDKWSDTRGGSAAGAILSKKISDAEDAGERHSEKGAEHEDKASAVGLSEIADKASAKADKSGKAVDHNAAQEAHEEASTAWHVVDPDHPKVSEHDARAEAHEQKALTEPAQKASDKAEKLSAKARSSDDPADHRAAADAHVDARDAWGEAGHQDKQDAHDSKADGHNERADQIEMAHDNIHESLGAAVEAAKEAFGSGWKEQFSKILQQHIRGDRLESIGESGRGVSDCITQAVMSAKLAFGARWQSRLLKLRDSLNKVESTVMESHRIMHAARRAVLYP